MEVRSLKNVRDNPYPKPQPLIESLINTGELVLVTGLWDSFKSRFSAELARSVVSGERFLGFYPINKPGPTLIIQKEINEGFYDERFLELSNGLSNDTPFYVSYDQDFRFDRGSEEVLYRVIKSLGLKLVIFDPLSYFWPTDREFDENNSGQVTAALTPLLKLRSTGCTFVIVHHDPKPSQGFSGIARGSSVLVNAPDTRILLRRNTEDDSLDVFARTRNIKGAGKFKAVLSDKGRLRYKGIGMPRFGSSGSVDEQQIRFWESEGYEASRIAQVMNIDTEDVRRVIG